MLQPPILRKVSLPQAFSMTLRSAYAQAAFQYFEGDAPTALETVEARLRACGNDDDVRRGLCEEVITFHTPQGDIPHAIDVARNNQLIGACRKPGSDFEHGYEPYLHAVIEQFTPSDAVIFDIGANWGAISLQTALRPDFCGLIHAFEPQDGAYQNLRDFVQVLGLTERIHTHQLALSDREGEAHLTDPKWRGGVAIDAQGTQGQTCRTLPLDALHLPDPHLIKIDVEGHEHQVLSGARQLLERARPLILFEDWLNAPSGHVQQLSHLGYQFYYPCWFDPFRQTISGRVPFLSSVQILALQPFNFTQREHFPLGINVLATPTALPPNTL